MLTALNNTEKMKNKASNIHSRTGKVNTLTNPRKKRTKNKKTTLITHNNYANKRPQDHHLRMRP